jgi:hypothetical protein
MSSTKRQQTMAKRERERAVEEKRTLKRLRKQAAKAEKAAGGPMADGPMADGPDEPMAAAPTEAEPNVE